MKALQDPSKWIRAKAIQTLAKIGKPAKHLVPQLIKMWDDKGWNVPSKAQAAIKSLGLNTETIKLVVQRLQTSPQRRHQMYCIQLLATLKTLPPIAEKALLKTLQSKHLHTQNEAAQLLARRGIAHDKVFPLLISHLTHKKLREETSSFLAKMGKKALPFLKALFTHKEPKLRKAGFSIIGQMGKDGMSVAPAVVKALHDPHDDVRTAAFYALVELRINTLPHLVKALSDPNPKVRESAASFLNRIGLEATPALPAALKAMKQKKGSLDYEVVQLIEKTGVSSPLVVDALLWILQHGGILSKEKTLELLAKHSARYPHIIPKLCMGLSDFFGHEKVRKTLESIGAPAAPCLIKTLHSKDSDLRFRAARALRKMGPKAAPHFIKALKQPNATVHQHIIQALSHNPTLSRLLVQPLTQALLDKKSGRYTKAKIIRALGSAGVAATKSVPVLMPFLSSKSSILREATIKTLGQIGTHAEKVLPLLKKMLDDKSDSTRQVVLHAIVSFGPKAKSLAPLVAKQTTHKNKDLRLVAAQALLRMGEQQKAAHKVFLEHLKGMRRRGMYGRWYVTQLLPMVEGNKEDLKAFLTIVKGLHDTPYYVSVRALGRGAKQGHHTKAIVSFLQRHTQHHNRDIRRYAVRGLGMIGVGAKASVPFILKALKNARFSKDEYYKVLGKIAPGGCSLSVPVLIKQLGVWKSRERWAAEEALIKCGALAVPALIKLLSHQKEDLRIRAMRALSKIGVDAKAALPSVLPLLKAPKKRARRYAAKALGVFGVRSPKVHKALKDMLAREVYPWIRGAAKRSLRTLGVHVPHMTLRVVEPALQPSSKPTTRSTSKPSSRPSK